MITVRVLRRENTPLRDLIRIIYPLTICIVLSEHSRIVNTPGALLGLSNIESGDPEAANNNYVGWKL